MYHSLAVAGNPGMFGSRRLLQSCNVHYPSHCQGCWIFTPCHIVEGAGFSLPVTLSGVLDFHYLSHCRGCWIFNTRHTVKDAGFSLPVTLSRVLDFHYLSHCRGCWIFTTCHTVQGAGFSLPVTLSRVLDFPYHTNYKLLYMCGGAGALSLTVNETLKWLSSLPTLMQESFWWWQCSDRYILSLSPTSIPPSLISLMVSVDVKHHVYLPSPCP